VPRQLLPSAHLLDAATNELLCIAAPLLAAGTVYGLGPASGFLLAAGTGAAGTAAIARPLTPHPAGARPAGPPTPPAPAAAPGLGALVGWRVCWACTRRSAAYWAPCPSLGSSSPPVPTSRPPPGCLPQCLRRLRPRRAGLGPSLLDLDRDGAWRPRVRS
jgi:hypothetical protein